MDIEEKRILGSLILLLGLTILIIGLVTGQVNYLIEFIKKVFEASSAGLP